MRKRDEVSELKITPSCEVMEELEEAKMANRVAGNGVRPLTTGAVEQSQPYLVEVHDLRMGKI